jgi:hypothetical protein
LLGQPAAEPPVVGRPTDWSGAIGGPFVVTMTAAPTELAAEDRLTLTLQIAVGEDGSAGNLRNLKRPALGKLDVFNAFAIEDLDENFAESPSRRWFRYLLRPRSGEVKEVPRIKFVYFNPRAGRYQTTYSNAAPLTVKPRTTRPTPLLTERVPEWMLVPATWEEIEGPDDSELARRVIDALRGVGIWFSTYPRKPERSQVRTLSALILPPAICAAWFLYWRRANPDAARATQLRRSRAASVALRTLATSDTDLSALVSAAVVAYLRERALLPPTATMPLEVEGVLTDTRLPAGLVQRTTELLRRCDELRFAHSSANAGDLLAVAEKLVLDWEALG